MYHATMPAPTNELTRHDFLRIGVGFLGAITLPLGLGCPADDGNDEGADSAGTTSNGDDTTTAADAESTAAAGCDMDPSATIATNHGHVLVVPLADVTAAADVTYDIMGTSAHTHEVTLTAADFASILAGMSVSVTSTTGDGHTHQVTVVCG
jgi:hypothetical protein